ncbi:MAG TPA: hypothetical protein VK694_05620 [Verrucomicrobiae bacterium]|nr:hypothetical protein [Verrucomicrobiae bacterium]
MGAIDQDPWFLSDKLEGKYPVASPDELADEWHAYTERETHALQGVLGAYAKPVGEVCAVASIDLCEVTRDTAVSLGDLVGEPLERGQYSEGTWYSVENMGLDFEYSVVLGGLQHLMNNDLVGAIPGIDEVSHTLRGWREQGVYMAANTSTLPGCELATIRHHLEKDLKGCFDALLLPRNYDGRGKMTKAQALDVLGQEAGIDIGALPLVHIDDATHHVQGFIDHFGDHPTSAFLMPAHNYNQAPVAEMRCEDPPEAFARAHEFLQKQGVLQ